MSISSPAKRPIDILEPYEIHALCDEAAESNTLTGIRDAALISFLYNSGLRISEALSVTPNDISERDGVTIINVRRGKGGRQGWSVLMPDKGHLAKWMKARSALGLKATDPLFCSTRMNIGGSLFTRSVNTMLRRVSLRAGVSKRVHCHAFRHSHAVALYSNGAPISTIQNQLRHSHALTTQRYLNHLGCIDTARVLAGLKWG